MSVPINRIQVLLIAQGAPYFPIQTCRKEQAYTAFTLIVRSSIPAAVVLEENKGISPSFPMVVASAIDFGSARGQKEIKNHLLCLRGVTNKTFHVH